MESALPTYGNGQSPSIPFSSYSERYCWDLRQQACGDLDLKCNPKDVVSDPRYARPENLISRITHSAKLTMAKKLKYRRLSQQPSGNTQKAITVIKNTWNNWNRYLRPPLVRSFKRLGFEFTCTEISDLCAVGVVIGKPNNLKDLQDLGWWLQIEASYAPIDLYEGLQKNFERTHECMNHCEM